MTSVLYSPMLSACQCIVIGVAARAYRGLYTAPCEAFAVTDGQVESGLRSSGAVMNQTVGVGACAQGLLECIEHQLLAASIPLSHVGVSGKVGAVHTHSSTGVLLYELSYGQDSLGERRENHTPKRD
jgi:hypothetical protein